MTEEERERKRLEEKIERQRLERKIEAQRAAAQAEKPAADFDPTWKDRAEMVTQGATLNLGDEIYSGLAAVGGEIGDMFSDDGGQTLGSRFRDKHQALNARREAYREARPMEALGLELAGGLTTGGVGLGRAAMARGLSHTARIARGVGTGAAEGAVAGFGSSAGDLEDRLDSARQGLMLGGATAGALGAGGAVLRSAAKRRVQKDLIDEKGRFTPIPLADEEGVLGSIYRQGVRRIWGAQQKLDEQGRWIMDRADNRVRRAEQLKEGRTGQLEPAGYAADDAAREARYGFEVAEGAKLDDDARLIAKRHREAKQANRQADEATQRQLNQRLDVEVEADRAAFRQRAAQRAVPEYAGDTVRRELQELDPETASRRAKDWWADNGFKSAKRNPIEWDQKFTEDLKFLVGQEPALGRSIYKEVIRLPGMRPKIEQVRAQLAAKAKVKPEDISIEDTVRKMLDTPHTMDGETFMAIRNTFARNANKSSDGWVRQDMRDVVNGFDTKIEDMLEGDDLAEFMADKAAYRDFVQFRNSVKDAFGDEGLFNETHWLRTAKKNTEVPGVGEARGLKQAVASRKEASAAELGRRQTRLKKALDKADAEKEAAEKALKKARKRLTKQSQDLGKDVKRNHPGLRKAKAAKKRADKRLKAANDEYKRLESLRGPESTSGLSALLTTVMAGSAATGGLLAGGPGAALAAATAGVRAGNFLTRPTVQRTLAGQTAMQQRWARRLRSRHSQIIPTATWRTAAGYAGNEDTLED